MGSTLKRTSFVFLLLAFLSSSGCNLWSSLNSTSDRDEIHSEALVKMDDNKCADAITELAKVTNPDNTTYRLRGWAKLCNAGAGVKKVLANLLNYSSSSNNLDIVVSLATSLIPQTGDTITAIDEAITSFSNQDTGNDRTVNLILGYMVKASALLAKQAGDSSISRSDFSVSGCLNADCSTGGGCTVNSSGTMSDSDANSFADALIQAGVSTSLGTSLGSLGDLVGKISQNVSSTTANINRCYIYNTLLSQ